MNDELSAWERSREATRRIMADLGRDERGYPLVECDLCDGTGEMWDPKWCGDADHCYPKIACPNGHKASA